LLLTSHLLDVTGSWFQYKQTNMAEKVNENAKCIKLTKINY